MGRVAGHHVHVVQQDDVGASPRRWCGNARPQIPAPRRVSRTPGFQFLPRLISSCKIPPPRISFPGGFVVSTRRVLLHPRSRPDPNTAQIALLKCATTPSPMTRMDQPVNDKQPQLHNLVTSSLETCADISLDKFLLPNLSMVTLRSLPVVSYLPPHDSLTTHHCLFHAVFISGFPKLPCACTCRLSLTSRRAATIFIDINDLARSTLSAIWHPTCNRTDRRHRSGAPRDSRPSVASARAGSANLLAFFSRLKGRNKFHARPRRAGSLELKRSPNLEEVIMNNRLLFALPLGRSPCYAGPCADHLVVVRASLLPPSRRSPPRADAGTATGKAPLAAPSREGFWGRMNPFARKKYVQAPDRTHPRSRKRTR